MLKTPKVIDADGHIYENHEEIEEYFEGKYRGMRRDARLPAFSLPRRLAARPRCRASRQSDRDQARRRNQVRRQYGI